MFFFFFMAVGISITSRGRHQLSSFSIFSVSSLFVTGNRCCWSLRLPALLLLFSESLHNCCRNCWPQTTFAPSPTLISRGSPAQCCSQCVLQFLSLVSVALTRRIHVPHPRALRTPPGTVLMLKPVKVGPKASVIWEHLCRVIVDFPCLRLTHSLT